MKKFWKTLLLFCITALLLTEIALANSAPPDYLQIVKIKNPPEEPYHLFLLAEEKNSRSDGLSFRGLNENMLQALCEAVPEGWGVWNGNTEEENGLYRFSGLYTPEKFRIAVVTSSCETWVSEIRERRTVQDTVTADWASKTISAAPVLLAVAMQMFSTLLPTLAVEGLLLVMFLFDWKKNWKPFLQVNLVTQTALAAFLSTKIVMGGMESYGLIILYMFFLPPIELVIAFTEAYLYTRWFTGHSENRAFAYGITANIASYVLGWYLVPAVWEGFVRTFWLGI